MEGYGCSVPKPEEEVIFREFVLIFAKSVKKLARAVR